MRLDSLKLHNFRQHRDTEITFYDGLTGIVGENGSGKTTILESIAWALYGQKAVSRMDRGKAETIRSRGTSQSDPAEVTLDFEIGGQRYRVVRREKDAAILANGLKIHTGTEPVTRAISQLLSMDAQAFFTSFFTGQKDLTFLRDVNEKGRQEYVSRLLGYERLAKARSLANDEKLTVRREVDALEHGLGDPEEIKRRKAEAKSLLSFAEKALTKVEASLKAVVAKLAEIEPVRAEAARTEKAHASLTNDLAVLNAQVEHARSNEARAARELQEILEIDKQLAKLTPSADEYEKLKQRYEELTELRADHIKRQSLDSQIASDTAEVANDLEKVRELEAVFATLAGSKQLLAQSEQELTKLSKSLQETERQWQKGCSDAEASLKSCKSRIAKTAEHLAQITAAGPDGVCPTCERALGDEFAHVTSEMQREIAEGQAEAKSLEKQIALLKTPPEQIEHIRAQIQRADQNKTALTRKVVDAEVAGRELKERKVRLEALRKRIKDAQAQIARLKPGYDESEVQELKAKATKLKPLRDQARELALRAKRRPEVEKQLLEAQTVLKSLTAASDAKARQIADLGFNPKAFAELESNWKQASEAVQHERELSATATRDRDVAKSVVETIEKEQQAYTERAKLLEAKQEQARHLDCLVGAFDSVRVQLNSQIRPRLSQVASELLTQVTEGRYNHLELSEDYRPQLFGDDDEFRPVISGGEEDITHLVVRLAVSQMIAERAGVDLGLLVLDEVFGSLDENRRARVIDLLQNLRSSFCQILLITHFESIHDNVDRCIWVQYDSETQTSQVSDGRSPDAAPMPKTPEELVLAP